MLRKEHLELARKYTFIDDARRVGLFFVLYYTHDGEKHTKRLPLRSTVSMLQRKIKDIKKEIGVGLYGQAKEKIYVVGRD